MRKLPGGYYVSPVLDLPHILHGFSTRQFGDMRKRDQRRAFVSVFGYQSADVVWPEQVHGASIHRVSVSDRGKTILGVDGLAYRYDERDLPVVLSVHTADCVPILACDPKNKILGTAHAGWRGTLSHIGSNLIREMEVLGACVRDIRVTIGPGICGECYTVPEERASACIISIGRRDGIFRKDGMMHLDLGIINYHEFCQLGIAKGHIDSADDSCTYHGADFFSFRKTLRPLDGEHMGIIGFGKRKP